MGLHLHGQQIMHLCFELNLQSSFSQSLSWGQPKILSKSALNHLAQMERTRFVFTIILWFSVQNPNVLRNWHIRGRCWCYRGGKLCDRLSFPGHTYIEHGHSLRWTESINRAQQQWWIVTTIERWKLSDLSYFYHWSILPPLRTVNDILCLLQHWGSPESDPGAVQNSSRGPMAESQ